jgi:hypothetical protein
MMGIIRNTTEGIHPYFNGGFKRGEMAVISSGRQTGKSTMTMLKSRIYNANLCKEIILSNSFDMTVLESMLIPGYPKTSNALKKLMPTYKFSRANWYVAEFDWVHQHAVLAWCSQQFGPHPARPDAWSRWYNKYSERIHFRDEKDYQWFLLKWGV